MMPQIWRYGVKLTRILTKRGGKAIIFSQISLFLASVNIITRMTPSISHPLVAQSPGRINLIGEHTDYNDGFVLPAAIDKTTTVRLWLNGSESRCTFTAGNVGESYTFDLNQIQPLERGWQNYVMGVVAELQNIGAEFKGFDCQFEGDVPIGSGMSSSAALECSLAFGLNELFALGFDRWQLIKASQKAEHNYVGIMSGIMDQFASMMGKANHAMLLDCRSLEFEYFPLELGNYELLLLNTNVSHALADSAYNKRRQECEEGVAVLSQSFPEVRALRDAKLDMLAQVKTSLSPEAYKRSYHVITEIERVFKTTEALKQHDFQQVGANLYASHHSLQHDFEVSCEELDFLVDLSQTVPYVLGSRMMGGGFGGCTLNLIEKEAVPTFIELASEQYRTKFGVDLTPYQVLVGDGAKRVEDA